MNALIELFIKTNPFTITTASGEVYTGYLKDQDADAIVLATQDSWTLIKLENILSIRLAATPEVL